MKNIFIKENMCTIYKLVFHGIQKALQENGYTVVEDPEHADICLAGLCAAFDADEDRSRRLVNEMALAGKPLYLYGCLTSVNPEGLPAGNCFPSWAYNDLARELAGADVAVLPHVFRSPRDYRVYNPRRKFIGITTGCSFSCSYCPHKIGSGELVSVPESVLLEQIKELVTTDGDVDTIVITGIDTACYGADTGTFLFPDLLRNILDSLPSHVSIHISQFNPEGLFFNDHARDSMQDLLASERIKDIQLPIQTASPRLLKLMQRHYDIDKLGAFLRHVKTANPQLMLRSDLMVGFPTETYEDLDASIAFVAEYYSEIAVYAFEMKQRTPISSMGLVDYPEGEKEARRRHVVNECRARGMMVHSGGQLIDTLFRNDAIKEKTRKDMTKK